MEEKTGMDFEGADLEAAIAGGTSFLEARLSMMDSLPELLASTATCSVALVAAALPTMNAAMGTRDITTAFLPPAVNFADQIAA